MAGQRKKSKVLLMITVVFLFEFAIVALQDYQELAFDSDDEGEDVLTRYGRDTNSDNGLEDIPYAISYNKSTNELDFYASNVSNLTLGADDPAAKPNGPAAERMNQSHADAFKVWLDSKSKKLFEMSITYSGYKILNSTYDKHLRNTIKYSWINFTDMIVNISSKISEVLYSKTVVVQNLTDLVEKTFEDYRLNEEQINESMSSWYYDAKSPYTFCDTAEIYKNKLSESKPSKSKTALTTTTTTTTAKPTTVKSKKVKRADSVSSTTVAPTTRIGNSDGPPTSSIPNVKRMASTTVVIPKTTRVISKKRTTTPVITTTTTMTTTPEFQYEMDYDDDDDDSEGDGGDNEGTCFDCELGGDGDDFEVPCLNRTYDENFKSVQKINLNQSTVHVPTNIYKKDISINMTAYWTEALDEQFKKNYENDNELFWQYFCSSQGAFRRYPGYSWNVPRSEDFFDCRLQSWYVSAAASSKDVVFLLDTSGSMTGLRLEIGKRLIEFIMDTFTDNDFFNIFTFNTTAYYLMSEPEEAHYRDQFIQASKENKQKFIQKLYSYKYTNNIATLNEPLSKVFDLFSKSKSGCKCNQAIMIITDGSTDNIEGVFQKFNPDKLVRVFSFKIGRDMTDSTDIKKMACQNNGEYYHVVTLTDINEHVYEYIPVLSRPMALTGVRDTRWSNVFVGHLDKELKIAVARPAFRSKVSFKPRKFKPKKNNTSLGSKYFNQSIINSIFVSNTDEPEEVLEDEGDFFNQNEHERNNKKQAVLKQVLLGVVGVDVPVLRLISKVSPKYQMGVGIYIIMLDNNGFIVFHPSIKREITKGEFDIKGTSHSIDLDKFEIPIGNDDGFEQLEHDMIDQKTGSVTLNNWKREGLRVTQRSTEYVFTPVNNSPFSVAIASPSSFGRYYIDLPQEKQNDFEKFYREVNKQFIKSNIQLYNCTYNISRLSERLQNPKQYSDYCIRYLFTDTEQVLALKTDLALHDIYYHSFNFSVFKTIKNLVKSSFYGTYSGITFYLPVTFYRPKSNENSTESQETTPITPTEYSQSGNITEEAHTMSLNLFSTESNKHTYSFEKQYYTRTIEFTDYLRTEFKLTEPFVIYFLNETSKEARHDTLSAASSVWLDKVPAAVAGVVYDANLLEEFLFDNFSIPNCPLESCYNLCNRKRGLAVTCYLVDEHGVIVLSNSEQQIINKALHLVNPWLMKQLENDGMYQLIIPGNTLKECAEPLKTMSSSSMLKSVIGACVHAVYLMVYQLVQFVFSFTFYTSLSYVRHGKPITEPSFYSSTGLALGETVTTTTPPSKPETLDEEKIRKLESRFRFKQSNCYYFGIYSFNLTKWRELDAGEFRPWCVSNGTVHKRYLAGHLTQSNLLMLVVEDETSFSKCGNITDYMHKDKVPSKSKSNSSLTKVDGDKPDFRINRYRKQPASCYNFFPNESLFLSCKMSSATRLLTSRFSFMNLIKYYLTYLITSKICNLLIV